MKKTFFTVTVILAAVGCTKKEGFIEEKSSIGDVILYAYDVNAIESKTTTSDTYTVNWNDGDNVSVFTSEAGALPTDYASWCVGNPVKFSTNEEKDGCRIFRLDENITDAGKMTDYLSRYAAGVLDWYVVYPGFLDTPSNPGKSVIVFGNRGEGYAQKGNDNREHLCRHDVLFGKATGTNEPYVEMQHIGALQQVTVKNRHTEAITVQSVSMSTTSAYLTGEFRLNMTSETPFVPTDYLGGTVSNEFVLDVTGAAPIEPESSATFYFVTPPFKFAAGEDMTIAVVTNKGICSKTMTASTDKEFLAGYRYNANITFDEITDYAIQEYTGIQMNIDNSANPCKSALNLSTGEVFDLWQITTEEQQAKVDLISLYSSSLYGVLAGPGNGDHFSYMSGTAFISIPSWSKRNNTYFKRIYTTSAYNTVKSYSDIKNVYDSESDNWTVGGTAYAAGSQRFAGITNDNKSNLVIAAKTEDGRYALISISAIGNGSITLNVKTCQKQE
ncbi:MAG: hypothetical protein ACI39U_07875 [Candidatus Cryptobacteroides sp.]